LTTNNLDKRGDKYILSVTSNTSTFKYTQTYTVRAKQRYIQAGSKIKLYIFGIITFVIIRKILLKIIIQERKHNNNSNEIYIEKKENNNKLLI